MQNATLHWRIKTAKIDAPHHLIHSAVSPCVKIKKYEFSNTNWRLKPSISRESFMPIYAYKCSACGHTKDALQKMSDAPLTDCPACGKATFSKQVTAAGFQLKGGGWYVTDFKSGNQAAPAAKAEGDTKVTPAAADGAAVKPETKSDSASASPASSAPVATPVAATPAAKPAPAPAATT
jgi:putative FmdB family regulatory protein